MSKIRGGCLCGGVRYEADAEPLMVAVCHCATCQKNTGSAFSVNLGMPEKSVKFTGESLATYADHTGASGKPFFRRFCSRCGSPISGHGEAYSGVVFIKGGTLDDPSWIAPDAHIWCAEKQPWVLLGDTIAALPGNPS